jgi:uncharacterized protein YcfL
MTSFLRLIALAMFSIFGLFACTTKAVQPTNYIIEQQENLKTEKNQARFVEPATKVVGQANNVIVREIRVQTIAGKMIVDYVFLNDRGRRDVINYRMRWLDPNGMVVSQYDPWETMALEGHEQSVLSVTAPTPVATDFRIEIKPNQ